jgi:hypothetical protein
MPSDFPMTYDEFMDNYEFKVAKRILMREYPWIKDVQLEKPDELNRWNLIFLDLSIDPFELSVEKGWPLAFYVTNSVMKDGDFWSPYLSTYYSGNSDEARELVSNIEKMLEDLHRSPAIPKEMKLPGHRKLNIGSWHIQPGTQVPTDYVDWLRELR